MKYRFDITEADRLVLIAALCRQKCNSIKDRTIVDDMLQQLDMMKFDSVIQENLMKQQKRFETDLKQLKEQMKLDTVVVVQNGTTKEI